MTDPMEQIRDLVHKHTPMIYTEDEEAFTSEIMKLMKERDERIKELENIISVETGRGSINPSPTTNP